MRQKNRIEMTKLTDHFDSTEMDCPCMDCVDNDSGKGIDRGLVNALEIVREVLDRPIHITSGVRCEQHNKDVGGKSTSEHLDGKAVDIRVDNSRDRSNLLAILFVHFERIGIGSNFIHVGVSSDKAQNVVWVY